MSGDSRILSLEAWKALALKGAAPQEAGVCKPFVLDEVKAVEGDERALRIRITTAAVDRDGDTISPTGWKLTNYRKNPVVLYGHDYRGLPIARNTKIEPDEGGIVGTPHFVEPEIYPLAETVLQMLKRRYLNAASVGFLPYEWTRSEDDARKPRQGVDFSKQELLEYSIVPVPSNPEALVEARSVGIDITPLKEWAERVLDDYHQDRGLYLPRRQLEAVVRLVDPRTVLQVQGLRDLALELVPVDANRQAQAILEAAEEREAKTVPPDVSRSTAGEGTAWSRPGLKDFTDKGWGDLSDGEKRKIAGHFAWAKALPPAAFGDLKLPHHRASDGAVVWNGVKAAMGALLGARGGADIPDDERRAVYTHLARHYRQFEKEPPEFPAIAADPMEELVRALEAAGPEGIQAALRPAMQTAVAEHTRTALTALTGRLPD